MQRWCRVALTALGVCLLIGIVSLGFVARDVAQRRDKAEQEIRLLRRDLRPVVDAQATAKAHADDQYRRLTELRDAINSFQSAAQRLTFQGATDFALDSRTLIDRVNQITNAGIDPTSTRDELSALVAKVEGDASGSEELRRQLDNAYATLVNGSP